MMKGGLGGMMKQAQQMQQNMQKAQAELATVEVEGQAGSGMVKVTMTCGHVMRRVSLDDSVLTDDKEMLEDLIVLARQRCIETGGINYPAAYERIYLWNGLATRDEASILMSFPLMMPSHLEELITALRCLPGVGPKSAQRMAYHLLQRDRAGALHLAQAMELAVSNIQHCSKCNNFSEHEVCSLCASPKRDASLLCVVEMPADLLMMEQTQCYRGQYFVLMGRLSPLDGIRRERVAS